MNLYESFSEFLQWDPLNGENGKRHLSKCIFDVVLKINLRSGKDLCSVYAVQLLCFISIELF